MGRRAPLAGWAIAFVVAVGPPDARAEGKQRPSGFSLTAEYVAGIGSLARSWKVAVAPDGTATREVTFDGTGAKPPAPTRTRLGAGQIKALAEALDAARFESIPGRIEDRTTRDGDVHILRVTRGGKSHEVWARLLLIDSVRTTEPARRVIPVWAELLAQFPSPNADQTASRYRP